jgi:hypothetical protein
MLSSVIEGFLAGDPQMRALDSLPLRVTPA